MIAPGFESHQCLAGMWKRLLGCHAGHQEVGRCRTRDESQGMCNITHMPLLSSNKAEPTLALKPRGDVTRSLKEGYQWPHKKGLMSCKNYFKKSFISPCGSICLIEVRENSTVWRESVKQENIQVGCLPPGEVTSTPGGRVCIPALCTLPPWIPYPMDTLSPERTWDHRYPIPP